MWKGNVEFQDLDKFEKTGSEKDEKGFDSRPDPIDSRKRDAKVPVKVRFHPHAMERMLERGATEDEVRAAIEGGERIAAKYGRIGFRRNFSYDGEWQGRRYANKQLEVYAVEEQDWLVITVIVKYF